MKRLFRIWWPNLALEPIERETFRRHLLAAAPDGAYFGCMMIAAYILKRALHASDFLVTLFFALQMSMFIFSSVASSFLNRKNHRRFILSIAFLGPLSLISLMLYPRASYLVALVAWVNLIQAIYLPARKIMFWAGR